MASKRSKGPSEDHLVPVSFVILGPPRTKKNSSRIVRAGRFNKILPSEAYLEWNEEAQFQLIPVRNRGTIQGPVNCAALIYREKLIGDAVGFYQAIADTLQDARVVHDDYLIVSWDGSRILKDANNPRVEITLTAADIALARLPAIPPKGAGREWLKCMAHEEDKQNIYIPPSMGKFAVFGPGMSGTTDDFGLAQTWLLNNPKAVLYYARAEPKAALFDEMLAALKELYSIHNELVEERDCICGSNDLGGHSQMCIRTSDSAHRAVGIMIRAEALTGKEPTE